MGRGSSGRSSRSGISRTRCRRAVLLAGWACGFAVEGRSRRDRRVGGWRARARGALLPVGTSPGSSRGSALCPAVSGRPRLRTRGRVLRSCALGLGRSAAIERTSRRTTAPGASCSPSWPRRRAGADGLRRGTTTRPVRNREPAEPPRATRNPPVSSAGQLTVGDFHPWFPPCFARTASRRRSPTGRHRPRQSGEGFESAVAYAIAEQLGSRRTRSRGPWKTFDESFKPGDQGLRLRHRARSRITPKRAQAVDFSESYYDVTPALVALKGTADRRRDDVARPQGLQARRADRHHELQLHRE